MLNEPSAADAVAEAGGGCAVRQRLCATGRPLPTCLKPRRRPSARSQIRKSIRKRDKCLPWMGIRCQSAVRKSSVVCPLLMRFRIRYTIKSTDLRARANDELRVSTIVRNCSTGPSIARNQPIGVIANAFPEVRATVSPRRGTWAADDVTVNLGLAPHRSRVRGAALLPASPACRQWNNGRICRRRRRAGRDRSQC